MFKKLYLSLTLLTALLWLGSGTMWGETQVLSEGFEGSDFDSKWEKRSCISSSQVYSSAAYGGSSYGFRFYYNTTPPQYLISKSELSIPAGAEVKVSFYYRGSSSTYNETFHVGYSTTDNQTASFIWSDEIASNKTTTWKEYINENFPSETKYIAFKYTANNQYYLYIDDIVVSYTIPSCPKPALSLDETDVNSATFSWTQGGTEEQWQYLYLPAATTLTDSHWDAATLTNSKSATISGLTSGSKYTFYVRSYCSAGDQSKPASLTFRADCSKVSIPAEGWTYGFETADGASAGSIPNCWIGLAPSGVNYPTISSSYVKEGSYKLQFQGKSADAPQYIVLPEFEVPVQNLKLTFWYRRDGDYSYTSKPQVGYFTTNDPEVNSEFVSLSTAGSISTTYTSYTFDFKDAPVTAKRIAIKFTGGTYTSYTGGLFVDNIKVESTQDCSKPATPTYSDLTGSSVTINWTANAGVDDYKYINVDRTATPDYVLDWENDATPVTGTSVALSELVDGHNYEFYVMCGCGTVASDACTYQPLSCPNVTEVSLSNQLWNGVTINWTTSATTNCDVQYKAGSGEWQTAETNTSATSKVISGLSVGTEYSFRVKPNCSADGWISSASTYTPACPALGALSLSGQTYNGVTVSWSAVAGISSWNLRYRKGSDSWTEVNNIAALTYTIASGLVTNEEYTIELYSECGGSAASTTYTPVYEIPAVLTASPVKDVTATLNWSTVDGANGYQYSCVKTGQADAWSATQVANTTSLSGLEVAEEYTAKVRAVFGGSGYSDPKVKNFTTVCQAPISLVKGETSSSSLAFSWSKSAEGNADNRYQYVCKEGSAAPTADQWASAVLLDEGVRTATVTGLSANTTYYFFVRSYYADGKYSDAINTYNTTDCGINSIGWSENFNAGSVPTCWTITNKTSYGWATYNYTDETGSYCMRYNGRGSSGYYELFATPSILLNDKAMLKFYRKTTATSPEFKVLISKDGGTTKTEIGSYTASTTKRADSISLVDYINETVIIYFQGKSSNTSGRYVYLDDVDVHYMFCATPTSLAAAPTTDGADVTWDAEEGPYDLQYRINGSSDAWTTVSNIADKNYTIEGLTSGTTYEVQVRAHASANRISSWTASQTFTPVNCPVPTSLGATAITHNSAKISWSGDAKAIRYKKGSDDWSSETISPADESFDLSELVAESTYTVQVKADCEDGDNWSEELEFTTKCTPITITKVAPFEADFAGLTNEMPSCWEKSETTYPYVTSGELKFYANEENQTAILPAFTNDIATLVLKFNYKNYSSLSGYGKLQVGYINTSDVFVPFGGTLANKVSYDAAEINFYGVENAKNIAIRFLDNANSEAYSYVKDVVVELAPTCYAPAAINEPTDITGTSATITWDPSTRNNETHYLYTCVLASEEPDWSAATKVVKAVAPAENTANLSGLTPTSDYVFYVRSLIEANNDTSDVISKAFQTECGIEAVPYEEDFTSTTLPRCWANSIDGDNSTWSVYSAEVGYGGSGCSMRFNGNQSSSYSAHLSTPSIAIGNDSTALHFFYQNTKGATFKVFVKEGDEDSVQVADLSQQTGDWTDKTVLLSSYKNKTLKFYFFAQGNATSASAIRLDNVSVNRALLDNADNSDILANLNGQTLDVIIGRTFIREDYDSNQDHYNTICLPFDLSAAELAASPIASNDLWAFKYAKVENDELLFRIEEVDHIEAGKPYFIGFEAGDNIVNPLFKNVTIKATEGKKVGDANVAQLCGILKPEPFPAGDDSKLFLYTQTNTLYWWNGASASQLNGFRAFFQLGEDENDQQGAPIRRGMPARIVKEEQVATGIDNTKVEAETIKLIENNQVVIIRNGVKYNIQGQVIEK